MSAVTIDLGERGRTASLLLDALPHPVLLVDGEGQIEEANIAAENFFQASTTVLRRHPLGPILELGARERAPARLHQQHGVGGGRGPALHQLPQRGRALQAFVHGCPLCSV